MIKLLIFADDFTGALDTAVQFSVCGADVQVVTNSGADIRSIPDCEVLVVDTETRHISPEQAADTVARLTERAVTMDIPYLYKKTDSALRGNVGAELAAMLRASGETYLPFLPTFPQIGRYTKNGIHYIQDVPVAQSVFGQDPFEPVRHSAVSELIAEQSDVSVNSYPVLTAGAALSETAGIQVFDATTIEDLEIAGQKLLNAGRLRIMAGCAGFASILPNLLGIGSGIAPARPELDPKLLVICGSVNPITIAQLDKAESSGFFRHRLTPEQKLDPGYWSSPECKDEIAALNKLIEQFPLRIIETNDEGGNQLTSDYAAARGMTIEDIRQGISRTLGCIVSQLFLCPSLGTLLVTGGDTLLECMNYMGVHQLQPICELDHGVVLSRFQYKGCTRYVITKSGGFGAPDLLIKLADQLAKKAQ